MTYMDTAETRKMRGSQITMVILIHACNQTCHAIYTNSPGRVRLDRRLETAHFKYAVLKVASCYPNHIDPDVILTRPTSNALLCAFHENYSSICALSLDTVYST